MPPSLIKDLPWEALDSITIQAIERQADVLLACMRDNFRQMSRGKAEKRLYFLTNFLDELERFKQLNEIIEYYGGEKREWTTLILKK